MKRVQIKNVIIVNEGKKFLGSVAYGIPANKLVAGVPFYGEIGRAHV